MKALLSTLSALSVTLSLALFAHASELRSQRPNGGVGESSAGGSHGSFTTQILPILTKAGCNAGACHGAAIGQGGFKLSLLGYDPESDYHAITRQFSGRRVDLSFPAQSLFLRKATRDIRHKGGERIERDSNDYRTLVDWVAASAPFGPRELNVRAITVSPADILVAGPGRQVQLHVTAMLSDGSTTDATEHALYSSNDDTIATTGDDGSVNVIRRGTTSIMIRYGGQVAAVRAGAPFRDAEVDAAGFAEQNFVDREVWRELRRMRVPPSPLSDDAEFLRRAHVDLTGRLPSADEVRTFLAEPSTPARRARVINELLKRPEFTDLWTLRLSDLLLIDSKRLGEAPARAYRDWVHEQVARNVPLDRLVRELLTARGDVTTSPSANFHRTAQDPRDMGEYVSSALLGVQIACARCHAHPFASWTQDDFYGFAAFFARIRQEGSRVVDGDRGEVRHPRTGSDVAPRPLGAESFNVAAGDRPRGASLAEWITSPHNPYFAKAVVNRVWRHLMGRGIVEPVDDLRATNPPSNPALLDALAADFVAGGFDLRRLIRTIAESLTYQLSSRPSQENREDDRLFSHARLKPLPPQVLADAIADATGVSDAYPGYAPGTRAVQLVDSRTPSFALDVLGRCTRETACEMQPRGGGVSQALHLMNGTTINDKLRDGVADRLTREGATDVAVVEELYLRTLSRFPSSGERDFGVRQLTASANAAEKRLLVQDLLWALLNSREFAYNH